MDIISYSLADEALEKILQLGTSLNEIETNLGADYKQGYGTTTDLLAYLLLAVEGNEDVQTVLANFAFVETEADLPVTDANSEAKFFFVRSMKGIYVYDEVQGVWIGLFGSALTQLQNDVRAAILKSDQALTNATNAITTADTTFAELQKVKSSVGKNTNDIVIIKSDITNLNTRVTNAQNSANSALSFAQGVKGVADRAETIALEARELARTANEGLTGFTDEISLAKSMSTAAQDTANTAASVASSAKTTADTAFNKAVNAENTVNSVKMTVDDANFKADEALNQATAAKTATDDLTLKVNSATNKADAATTTANTALSKANANETNIATISSKADNALTKADQALAGQADFDSRLTTAESNSSTALTKATNAEGVAKNAQIEVDALRQAWETRAQPAEDGTIDYDTLNNKIMVVEAKAIEADTKADDAHLMATNSKNTVDLMDGRVTTLESKVTTNTSDVTDLKNKISTIDSTLQNHLLNHPSGSGGGMTPEEKLEINTRLDNLESKDVTHDSEIASIKNKNTLQDQKITQIEGIANNSLSVAQGIDSKAQSALDTANLAKSTANGIDAKAQSALDTSNLAKTTADTATTTANSAKTIAEGIEGKADSAILTANQASTDATTAVETADAAKVTAEGIEGKADSAVLTANEAKTTAQEAKDVATFVDSKASRALTKSFDAESIALGIEGKADEALANSAKAVTDSSQALETALGIDGKATKALTDSTDSLSIANQAKTTADGIDAKATQALSKATTAETNSVNAVNTSNAANTTSNQAKTTADQAYNIATGIDAKAQSALDMSASANTSANQALQTANAASAVASSADNKSEDAIDIATQAMGRFDLFQLRGWVQTLSNLNSIANPKDGDVYIVRDERTFVYYDANQDPAQWVGLGIGEDLMRKLLSIEKDIKDSASPYDSLKNRLDRLEGYLRFWELTRLEDFRGGTFEDTKYDGGVVLDKGIDVEVVGDVTLATDDFQRKTTVANYNADHWYGKHHVMREVFLSTNTYQDLDMNIKVTFSGLDQAKVVGARLNANGTNGYIFIFTREAGIDLNTQLPKKNTISMYRITGGTFVHLQTVPFYFEELKEYKFRIRLEGANLTVWQGLANVLSVTESTYTAAGHIGGYRMGKRREMIDYTYTDNEDVKVVHSNESNPYISLISK